MSEPSWMSPAPIRSAPTQSTPMLETLMMNITVGNIDAIRRPVRSEVSVRSCVGRLEARDLLGLAHEGPHDPDAGDLLAEHPVDLGRCAPA